MSDRRAVRRQETIEEIVAISLREMTRVGAGGLSLGAVARELGIRTPSLYGYFDSKAALYDEIFRRGWVEIGELIGDLLPLEDLRAQLAESFRLLVVWSAEHPAQAQLMFWRPVPSWEPSPEAFEPALVTMGLFMDGLTRANDRGDLRTDVPLEEQAQVWSALVTGVISQQLSNEPGISLEEGRVSRYLDSFVDMFINFYSAGRTP